jgi:hypothetical protein
MHSDTPDIKNVPSSFEEIKRNLPSEGDPFASRKESLQRQIEGKKFSCHSSWCESCWKRYGKKGLVGRLASMDWKYVGHGVLSVNPFLYGNGEDVYQDIACGRGIGNLVKNLDRTESLNAQDFRSFLSVVDFLGSGEYWMGKGRGRIDAGRMHPPNAYLKIKCRFLYRSLSLESRFHY